MADSGFSRNHVFGDAIQVLAQLADSSEEAAVEQAVLSAAFEALCINSGLTPGLNPRVALKLHKCGLLEKASTNHMEVSVPHRLRLACKAGRSAGCYAASRHFPACSRIRLRRRFPPGTRLADLPS